MTLRLTDYGVKAIRRTHPLLGSKKPFARGTYSAVFEGTSADTVLKLTTDPAHYCYLTDYCAPQGIHKPRVVEDFSAVGETVEGQSVYLLEVERLEPLRRGTPGYRLAQRIVRSYVSRDRESLPEEPELAQDMDEPMVTFLTQLNWFLMNYDCQFDAKVNGNFLVRRGCGTLVASDPVFTPNMHRKPRAAQPSVWH